MNPGAKKIESRKANLNDLDFIKKCLVDSWSEHARQAPTILSKNKLEAFESLDFYKKSIADDEECILISECEGERVGVIVAYTRKLSYFFLHPQSIYIDDIYVLKDFRQLGVAKKMIEGVEEFAKSKGIKRLDSRVYSYNIPMQKLLTKLGYHSPFSTWVKVL